MTTPKLTRSYYHANTNIPAFQHTLPDILDFRGTTHPEREAFVIRDLGKPRQVITFGELKSKTEQLAAGLIKRGLKKGDCVGLLCPTSIEYAICEYALARTGAILMRYHVSMKSGDDIRYMLRKSNCRWLIAHPGGEDENYHILQILFPKIDLHDPSQKLSADDLPDLETIFIISSASYPGTISWTALFERFQDGDLELVRSRQTMIDNDDIQCCYATSGSTGRPKLVASRYLHSLHRLRTLMTSCRVNEKDIFLTDRPMCYVGGCSGMVLGIGIPMVYINTKTTVAGDEKGRDFFFDVLQKEKCTAFIVYPYILRDLLRNIEDGHVDVGRIKAGVTGGEHVPKLLLEKCLRCIPNLILAYGSTESGVVVATQREDPLERKLAHTGKCIEGEFKIVDGEGLTVPIDNPGELYIRNHHLFIKYYGDEEKTKMVKDLLGWYRTGDMATMDPDGYLTILGRQQEVISKATMKIYPRSVERVLLQNPLVENVIAVGIPHDVLHEEICVCVVPKKNVNLTVDDVRQYCRDVFTEEVDGLGLMPDYILMFDQLPVGSTSKVDRVETKAKAMELIHQN